MSKDTNAIRALAKSLELHADEASAHISGLHTQVTYLRDKLDRVFHSLQHFSNEHGGDLHPDVRQALAACWLDSAVAYESFKQKVLDEDWDFDE
jgi:hypothetical protein